MTLEKRIPTIYGGRRKLQLPGQSCQLPVFANKVLLERNPIHWAHVLSIAHYGSW